MAMVVVETAGAVVPFPKIFDEGFDVPGFEIAGDGLGSFAGDDDDRCGEFELAVGEVEGEFVDAVLRVVVIGLALPGDRRPAFGVEFYGVEFVIEIGGNGFIRISLLIHLFAPAAPGGVEVDEDRAFFFFQLDGGFANAQPGDGRLRRFGAGQDDQEACGQGYG